MEFLSINAADQVAAKILDLLAPSCERVAIVGAVRRKAAYIKTVDILCVPKYQVDMFGKMARGLPSQLDLALSELVAANVFGLRDHNGQLLQSGPRYKQYFYVPLGDVVNISIVSSGQWGVAMAIKTGPRTFVKRLYRLKRQGGMLPHGYLIKDHRLYDAEGGQVIETPEEMDVFKKTGNAWIEPQDRL